MTFNLRDFGKVADRFGIKVLSPGEALRRLERKTKRGNVALQLQLSLLDEARKVAESEGVPLNQFINVAGVEKLSALRTVTFRNALLVPTSPRRWTS